MVVLEQARKIYCGGIFSTEMQALPEIYSRSDERNCQRIGTYCATPEHLAAVYSARVLVRDCLTMKLPTRLGAVRR